MYIQIMYISIFYYMTQLINFQVHKSLEIYIDSLNLHTYI